MDFFTVEVVSPAGLFVLKRSLRFRFHGRLEPLPDAVFYELATKIAHPQLGCSPTEVPEGIRPVPVVAR